jgi:hypothetical protein
VKALVLDGDFEPLPGYPVTDWERETRTACQGCNVWRNTRLEIRDIFMPEVGPEDVLIRVAARATRAVSTLSMTMICIGWRWLPQLAA